MEKITQKYISELIDAKLRHNFGVDPAGASDEFFYKATVLAVLDIMRERRHAFRDKANASGEKTVYYLSMEFLMGRSLKNNLYNLGLTDIVRKALKKYDVKLENLFELEPDAGLGNGGLGRLAACFLDSLTSGGYNAMGYCIKYEFGIFEQKFVNGWQTEMPEFWLPGGSCWLVERSGSAVDVKFGGNIVESWDGNYHRIKVEDQTVVHAVPYDLMVAGGDGESVNVLRLWSAAKPEIDMQAFNQGDYVKALERQAMAEVISKVLYPEDNHPEGKSLRLRQQYFLVSASIQDILNRHMRNYGTLENLPEKAAIHINDTHPALVIPELMRHLLDDCGYGWDKAWDIVCRTAAYTNHTVMQEALECWQEDMFRTLLPRIYQIVKEIDNRYRFETWEKTHDASLVERTAVVQNGVIRMANLSVVACHSVNGVSRLHSKILTDTVFNDYYKLAPEKFTNVTNGVTFRRWLGQSNPELSELIKECIGDGFIYNTEELEKFADFAGDKAVLDKLEKIKYNNKVRFANRVNEDYGIKIDPNSIFDMQVKRLHEYKRQHLNALHIISDYLKIKANPDMPFTPKTYIFGAKAAPGYHLAKKIIRMILMLAKEIENDPQVRDKIKIVFVENYGVSLAELMIPAAELSEQISLASTEASGTGNMKLMLNGAITIGTEDGANVEIHEAVGDDNIIIFGMSTPEVQRLRASGYRPMDYYNNNADLKAAVDFIGKGIGGVDLSDVRDILLGTDYYMSFADFEDYCAAQDKASALYSDRDTWNRMSLINIAKAGRFSSDRSIKDYAQNIWNANPVNKK
ncbi:MAG: glycogen/starch/alpha-glucan phosphorylase [Clostridia bacterium]|nr:glycogen/starch/alpha-glucan phosphorylase [Clostridia bacterium]